MGKLSTPDWIREGYDSKADYEKSRQKAEPLANSSKHSQVKGIHKEKKKGKTFRVKKCPECGSTEVEVILSGEEGKEGKGWECKSCKWTGRGPEEKEMSEDEFMGHLNKMDGK